jgi:aminopeptidase Y
MKLSAIALLPFASALVIPSFDSTLLQNVFSLVDETPSDYEKLPLVETEQLQELITLDQLNTSAQHLYKLASSSVGQYDHPTRVIGSPGHWKTIGWIIDTLKDLKDYYTFETQEFKALDGKIFNYSLTINSVDAPVKPFQLTPPAHVYGANLFIAGENGCDLLNYAGIGFNSIALVKRGVCPFGNKSSTAGTAGAKAVIIYEEGVEDILSGTLGEPLESTVGTVGVPYSVASKLIDSKNSTLPVRINLVIDSYVGYIKTKNVIAETIHGDHDNVVSLGAHSDSVAAGPGINDDGSGTISLLTVAKQLTNFKVNNAVRFAWWAAEEEGLLGSNFYANSLTPEENSKLRLFMDYDMMASPNYEYQVYNGSNAVNPKGSEEIKDLYIDYYESKGLNWTLIPFDGRSDYVGFIENGIPGGGVAAGAEGKNSENGEVLDKCYHLLCDDLTNIAWDAFLVNTQLIAHSVATYGRSLEGFPLREMGVKSFNNDFAYRGDFLLY